MRESLEGEEWERGGDGDGKGERGMQAVGKGGGGEGAGDDAGSLAISEAAQIRIQGLKYVRTPRT